MKWKTYFKTLIATTTITWMIGFGIAIFNTSKFWGYFNTMVGGLVIYFLCGYYFKNEELRSSPSLINKNHSHQKPMCTKQNKNEGLPSDDTSDLHSHQN